MPAERTETFKEQAYRAIQEYIITNKMQRGKIYSEQWFADSLQISRTPVREAVLQLRSEGLLEILRNRGVRIKDPTQEDARNVFQMRAAIDGYCSAYMAEHHEEDAAVRSLREIRTAIERCHENFNHDDELFVHEEIVRFTGNPLFEMQFQQIRTRINIFWWDVIRAENRREEVYREHSAIIDDIERGDVNAAFLSAMEHNRITYRRLCEQYSFPEPRK